MHSIFSNKLLNVLQAERTVCTPSCRQQRCNRITTFQRDRFLPFVIFLPARSVRGPSWPRNELSTLVSVTGTRQTRCITRTIERKWKFGDRARRSLAIEQTVSACKQIATRIVTTAFCSVRSAVLNRRPTRMLGGARIRFTPNGKS